MLIKTVRNRDAWAIRQDNPAFLYLLSGRIPDCPAGYPAGYQIALPDIRPDNQKGRIPDIWPDVRLINNSILFQFYNV
jgi:hypothetical protein